MKIVKYIVYSIESSMKHRIGTNYRTREHQYYNHWTGRVYFEKF